MIETARLIPALWRWFINLHWVRYITGRRAPKVPSPEELGSPATEFTNEKKGTVDSESDFMDELPLLDKTQEPDNSGDTTEYGQSKLSRSYFSIFLPASAISPFWDQGCPE